MRPIATLISTTLALALLIPSPTSLAKQTLNQVQKDFLAAEKAFKANDKKRYQSLKAKLTHYPLHSYLEFNELSKQLTAANRKKIEKFIQVQQYSPLARRLKARYINSLANSKQNTLFAHYFADFYEDSKNAKLKCLYLRHQLATGSDPAKILPKADSLWNVAKSQPKQCDPLFKQWKADGRMNQAIIYQRFYKMAHSGPTSMLKYLSKLLPKNKQYISNLWLQARSNPGVIVKRKFFPQKNINLEAPIVVYAMKKLVWGDRDAAYQTWRKVKRNISLSKEHKREVERALFLALATENNDKAFPWAKRHLTDYLDDDLVSHWKLATFLRHEKWGLIKEQFMLLPQSIQKSNQWRYWNAVALEKGQEKQQAIEVFSELASERDYYGFKAASRLKQPLQLNHNPTIVTASILQQVRAMGNVERAKELFAMERYLDANREWRSLLKRLKTSEQIQAAAKIAHKWGWFNQGILTMAKAKSWDDTDIRFPTAFKTEYIQMAKKVNLQPQWLMGVARQESAYGPFAVSPAGAYGLMQVMPNTAKIYSKKFKIPYLGRKDLFKPKTNIEMGSRYLELRNNELEQNPIYASAAYNAGKHRIEKWKAFGRHPTEIWVESIPYTETRDYIKKVMTYRAIYALKLGRQDDVFDYIINSKTGG